MIGKIASIYYFVNIGDVLPPETIDEEFPPGTILIAPLSYSEVFVTSCYAASIKIERNLSVEIISTITLKRVPEGWVRTG